MVEVLVGHQLCVEVRQFLSCLLNKQFRINSACVLPAFGQTMGGVMIEPINPAIAVFPEPEPDDANWAVGIRRCATVRDGAAKT